jgi:proteasome accessory factor B
VADDERSGELRDFNLARIEDVRPTHPESRGGEYQIPDDFDLEIYFIDRFESLADEKVYEVRLLVEPEVVPYFESKRYHRTQQIHEEEADGDRAVVSYEVAGLEEIASFVRSWGPDVQVLRPAELAERIAEEARATLALYDESPPQE